MPLMNNLLGKIRRYELFNVLSAMSDLIPEQKYGFSSIILEILRFIK